MKIRRDDGTEVEIDDSGNVVSEAEPTDANDLSDPNENHLEHMRDGDPADVETPPAEPSDGETGGEPTPEGEETKEPEAGEVEPQPATDGDPYKELFEQYGLGRQFHDVRDLLARVPDMNRYIATLELENKKLRDQGKDKPTERPGIVPEDWREQFESDPAGALKALGVVTSDDLGKLQTTFGEFQEQQQRQADADVFASYEGLETVAQAIRTGADTVRPGFNPLYDAIRAEMVNNPGLDRVPLNTALKFLYPLAKERLGGRPKAPPVTPVSPQKKAGAVTTSGRASRANADPTPDLDKMTPEQFERHMLAEGRVGD